MDGQEGCIMLPDITIKKEPVDYSSVTSSSRHYVVAYSSTEDNKTVKTEPLTNICSPNRYGFSPDRRVKTEPMEYGDLGDYTTPMEFKRKGEFNPAVKSELDDSNINIHSFALGNERTNNYPCKINDYFLKEDNIFKPNEEFELFTQIEIEDIVEQSTSLDAPACNLVKEELSDTGNNSDSSDHNKLASSTSIASTRVGAKAESDEKNQDEQRLHCTTTCMNESLLKTDPSNAEKLMCFPTGIIKNLSDDSVSQKDVQQMTNHSGDKPPETSLYCSGTQLVAEENLVKAKLERGDLKNENNPTDLLTKESSPTDAGSYRDRRISHSDIKPFQCPICYDRFRANYYLARHMRSHTGEKPFHCTMCDYKTSEKGSLAKHLITHTGEKPFQCTMCEYSCSRKSSLTNHIRKHTGEKPYKCTMCDYKTSERSHLNRHIRTHSGEKPFQCTMCDYRSSHKDHVSRHIRRHIRT